MVSWSKVIPVLQDSGHKVIPVELPLYSVEDDVATVKRAIDFIGGPVILVAHAYGGFVITNAAYNNANVKGLVYVAAPAPMEGQSMSTTIGLATEVLQKKAYDGLAKELEDSHT
jgi:predicted alpha/beta hydrolase family esterase